MPVQILKGAEHPRLAGEGSIDCWLIVLTPGRYRLLQQGAESSEGNLSRILRQIGEAAAPGDVLDRTNDNALDAVPARLIPCTVSPPQPGWRINFPKEAKELVSDKEERSFVYVMIVAGFIEIWFPDTLRRALSGPIAEILP